MVFFPFLLSCMSEKEQGYAYVFETDLSSEEPQPNGDSDSVVEESEGIVDEPEDVSEEPESETDTADSNPDGSELDDSEICASLVEGVGIGDCAQNFSLTDIDQEMVSLHDFHGQVIFLDLSSFT